MISPENVSRRALEAARGLEDFFGRIPRIVVVLGSGWDPLVTGAGIEREIEFDSVPGFGPAGTSGHRGRVLLAETSNGQLLVQDGRLHCYEGYSSLEVSFPVWVYHQMGVRLLVMLSAAGGLNPSYLPGDLMIVSDHIFLFGDNPLRGLGGSSGRTQHVPGSSLYDEKWQKEIEMCLPEGTRCHRGVYAYVPGPSFETPAEATMLRLLGGDAVGMSTSPEALAASYLGIESAAVCCISNTLLPPSGPPPSHDTVLKVVRGTARDLGGLLEGLASSADMIV